MTSFNHFNNVDEFCRIWTALRIKCRHGNRVDAFVFILMLWLIGIRSIAITKIPFITRCIILYTNGILVICPPLAPSIQHILTMSQNDIRFHWVLPISRVRRLLKPKQTITEVFPRPKSSFAIKPSFVYIPGGIPEQKIDRAFVYSPKRERNPCCWLKRRILVLMCLRIDRSF